MYDVVVIGGGPSGISASLYAKRANLEVLVLHNNESNVEQAHQIDNFYGFPGGITGKELYNKGIRQAEQLGIEVKKVQVVGVENLGKHFNVKTVKGNFETKTIIISTGNKKIKPNIPGIYEFEGKGISYCAICDAFFFRNKNVAVLGNGEFAISEANELSHIVKKVTILTNGLEAPNTEYEIIKKKIKQITGSTNVEKIEFEDGSNLEIDGVFIALGEAGASDFAKTLGLFQDGDNIKVNEKMETNINGIYACGNITGGLLQVCKAVYEGAIAGLSAIEYIREGRKEK
ncbi:MAG: NAD(P)/FAD-dependent oxidoreductase [Clostridia bacterium]|nr:NAD(P)/FAD-dependent oxidoreductase [Clostridia bacterium]